MNLLSCDLPVLSYTPFETGKYDMSPGLNHFQLAPDDPYKRLIQLDLEYPEYRANKAQCRAHLNQYYGEADLPPDTLATVNETLIAHLCTSYPAYFQLLAPGQLHCFLTGETLTFRPDGSLQSPLTYQSLLDALVSHIQEDVAIWQLQGEQDWLAALHVCAPNGWAPAEKVGLSFDQVHVPVPGMERQRAQVLPLLKGLIQKPSFCRYIWDLRPSAALNHHPAAFELPPFQPGQSQLYVRVERQLLHGLPSCNAVLFMIRTYRYPVEGLSVHQRAGLIRAVEGMSPAILAYKRLDQDRDAILAHLQQLQL